MQFEVTYLLSSFDCFEVIKKSCKEYVMQQLPPQEKTSICLIQLGHISEGV